MKTDVYTQAGKKKGSIEVPEAIFDIPWNADLIHQVIVSMQANARPTVAHVKGRGDVAGGGRKPWKQKGTGRARHGSTRSPIWVGGGITHGPSKEKNYSKRINKKMRAKALFVALSQKMRDGQIFFVDSVSFPTPKAKDAQAMLTAIAAGTGQADMATKKRNAILIALTKTDEAVKKSFSNFGNVEVEEVRNLNPLEVLNYKFVIITDPEQAIGLIENRLSTSKTVTK